MIRKLTTGSWCRYAYAIVVAAEATAATVIVNYWTDKLPAAAVIAIFLIGMCYLCVFRQQESPS